MSMAYYTEIGRHRNGFVLFARARGDHGWMQLKLMRPPKTARSRRVWLEWNVDERRLGPKSEQRLAGDLPEIHDWVVEVLSSTNATTPKTAL